MTTRVFLAEGEAEVGLIEACRTPLKLIVRQERFSASKESAKLGAQRGDLRQVLGSSREDLVKIVGAGLVGRIPEDDPDGRINAATSIDEKPPVFRGAVSIYEIEECMIMGVGRSAFSYHLQI